MRHDRSRGGSISLALYRISRFFHTSCDPLLQLLLPILYAPVWCMAYVIWYIIIDIVYTLIWYMMLCAHSYNLCYMTHCVYTHMIYSIRYMTLCVHLYGAWYMVKQAPCYICMCVYACIYVFMYARVHECMHACTYVCMYVCMHVRMFLQTKTGGKLMMRHDRSRGGSMSGCCLC